MGMAMTYTYVTLKMLALQNALERGGFRAVGFCRARIASLIRPLAARRPTQIRFTAESRLSELLVEPLS